MTTDQNTNTPRSTRRPRSLSTQLVDLRESKRAALAKLLARHSRLLADVGAVAALVDDANRELARLDLAIGDARDSERADVPPLEAVPAVAWPDTTPAALRGVAIQPGANGGPDTAAIVRAQADGTAIVESTHDSVAHAADALHRVAE